jgi:hypothetical protein
MTMGVGAGRGPVSKTVTARFDSLHSRQKKCLRQVAVSATLVLIRKRYQIVYDGSFQGTVCESGDLLAVGRPFFLKPAGIEPASTVSGKSFAPAGQSIAPRSLYP